MGASKILCQCFTLDLPTTYSFLLLNTLIYADIEIEKKH